MSRRKRNPTPKSGVRALTEREVEVFELTVSGYQNARIASKLGISVKTVETHKHSVLIKLGVSSTAKLVSRYAQEYRIKKIK